MLRRTEYVIQSQKIPEGFDGYRIVHLSDLHGAEYGKHNRNLLRVVAAAGPDQIFMTGDIADNTKGAVDRALELAGRLAQKYPVCYVLGNHELALKKTVLSGYLKQMKKAGVRVLRNESCFLMQGNDHIRLYGLETRMVYYKDPFADYRRGVHFSGYDAEAALGRIDREQYSILLAHDPLYYPSYRRWGADLTFAGHIHGGVINVPFMGGLLSPDRTFFPKYDAGHFMEDGHHLVVSRGLGNHFLFRVNNPPEVITVVLRH